MEASSALRLAVVASALLTPLIVTAWARAFPPRSLSGWQSRESLRRRNGWIDHIATVCMFCGLIGPLLVLKDDYNRHGWWVIGLSFGLMISAHFLLVCFATIPFGGLSRFREFWRYYEVRWGIAMTGIRIVYIPIGVIGVYSAVRIWV